MKYSNFKLNVMGVYSNDAMLRQILEGVQINNVDEDSLIYSESERILFRFHLM